MVTFLDVAFLAGNGVPTPCGSSVAYFPTYHTLGGLFEPRVSSLATATLNFSRRNVNQSDGLLFPAFALPPPIKAFSGLPSV